MKVVIAPDSFKESLSSSEVAFAIKEGLNRVFPDAELAVVPIADGGEGTVNAFLEGGFGMAVSLTVTGPVGDKVTAYYGLSTDGQTAVIEMAQASGLHLVPTSLRNPLDTTSYGTGQMIKHALDNGARKLIIGLGGSATNDAGSGMLSALGVKFINHDGNTFVPKGARSLSQLARVDLSMLDKRLADCQILGACDVDNPLCGPNGATFVYGQQKGVEPEKMLALDQWLERFGHLSEDVTGINMINVPGAGAAGGMGGALLSYANATLRSGIEIVLETVGFKKQLSGADLVITGEGQMDGQSIHGKTPVGVSRMAKALNVPVIAIVGSTAEDYRAVYAEGIDAVFSCIPRPMSTPQAYEESKNNVANVTENVARLYALTYSGKR
ncbi:glycerate kinase [Vibrio ostreicida]|uniref:glycerate kinase n=1 Tax=Vibrio ostreicida TaxID=526588 RepID=UPI000970624D|nr:glycerate kinase [Vibrio ostreicida]